MVEIDPKMMRICGKWKKIGKNPLKFGGNPWKLIWSDGKGGKWTKIEENERKWMKINGNWRKLLKIEVNLEKIVENGRSIDGNE